MSFKNFKTENKNFYQKISNLLLYKKKDIFFSIIIFCLSSAICLIWLRYRKHHYAFIILNFINFCICVYSISLSIFRNLQVNFF